MAGMVRRTPQRYIRLKKAGELYGCSSKTIRRMGDAGELTLIPMKPGRLTTPYLVAEAEVLALIERREKEFSV